MFSHGFPKDVKKNFYEKEGILPHYLLSSSGSCHDFCKYGHKHNPESKDKLGRSKTKVKSKLIYGVSEKNKFMGKRFISSLNVNGSNVNSRREGTQRISENGSGDEEKKGMKFNKSSGSIGPVLIRQRSRVKIFGQSKAQKVQLDLLKSSEEKELRVLNENKSEENSESKSHEKRSGRVRTRGILLDLPNTKPTKLNDHQSVKEKEFMMNFNDAKSNCRKGKDQVSEKTEKDKAKKQFTNRIPSLKKTISIRRSKHFSSNETVLEEPPAAEEKSSEPLKMNFRIGKTTDLPKEEEDGPSKLQFQKGQVLVKNRSIRGALWRRSLSRKRSTKGGLMIDIETGVQVVVLRHQRTLRKNEQDLFNVAIEETARKLARVQNSKVKALVGAFESVISSFYGNKN